MSASTAVSGMQTAVGVAAAGVSNVATPGKYICCIPYNSTSRLVYLLSYLYRRYSASEHITGLCTSRERACVSNAVLGKPSEGKSIQVMWLSLYYICIRYLMVYPTLLLLLCRWMRICVECAVCTRKCRQEYRSCSCPAWTSAVCSTTWTLSIRRAQPR